MYQTKCYNKITQVMTDYCSRVNLIINQGKRENTVNTEDTDANGFF